MRVALMKHQAAKATPMDPTLVMWDVKARHWLTKVKAIYMIFLKSHEADLPFRPLVSLHVFGCQGHRRDCVLLSSPQISLLHLVQTLALARHSMKK
jgi:hypothetical protein